MRKEQNCFVNAYPIILSLFLLFFFFRRVRNSLTAIRDIRQKRRYIGDDLDGVNKLNMLIVYSAVYLVGSTNRVIILLQ